MSPNPRKPPARRRPRAGAAPGTAGTQAQDEPVGPHHWVPMVIVDPTAERGAAADRASPVRAALRELHQAGLLQYVPHQGAVAVEVFPGNDAVPGNHDIQWG